jgi:hypothetical protein
MGLSRILPRAGVCRSDQGPTDPGAKGGDFRCIQTLHLAATVNAGGGNLDNVTPSACATDGSGNLNLVPPLSLTAVAFR